MGCRCQLERFSCRGCPSLDTGLLRGKRQREGGAEGNPVHDSHQDDTDEEKALDGVDFMKSRWPINDSLPGCVAITERDRHDPVSGSRPAGGSRKAAFGFTIGSQAHLGQ